jgi:hypothetical protein
VKIHCYLIGWNRLLLQIIRWRNRRKSARSIRIDPTSAHSKIVAIMSTLQAIRYVRGKLDVLDQLRLPHEFHYDQVSTSEEAFECIRSMRVRGAVPTTCP